MPPIPSLTDACSVRRTMADFPYGERELAWLRRRFSPYCSTASLYFWAVAGGAIPELTDPADIKK